MTPQQRYLFDVDGVITVPGALTAEQVAEMNAAMDARSAAGLEVGASTNRVEEPLRDNPLHFAPAFRAVLDNPKITPILEELIGSGGVRGGGYYDAEEAELPTFRIDHVNLNNIVDTPGSGLHNGGDGGSHAGGAQFFHQQDGRLFNGLLVVAYELQDTIQNDGGFGCGAPLTDRSSSRTVPAVLTDRLFLLHDAAAAAQFRAHTKPTISCRQSGEISPTVGPGRPIYDASLPAQAQLSSSRRFACPRARAPAAVRSDRSNGG